MDYPKPKCSRAINIIDLQHQGLWGNFVAARVLPAFGGGVLPVLGALRRLRFLDLSMNAAAVGLSWERRDVKSTREPRAMGEVEHACWRKMWWNLKTGCEGQRKRQVRKEKQPSQC
jgi:hypothetical protein